MIAHTLKSINNVVEIASIRAQCQRKNIGTSHSLIESESRNLNIDTRKTSISITVESKASNKKNKG